MNRMVFKGKDSTDSPGELHCSFCGKSHSEERKMVAGPRGVAICKKGLSACTRILADLTPEERPH